MADEQRRSQGRAQAEQAQRRRRGDGELRAEKRLPIPPEVAARLEAEGLHPRWVNDENNRLYRFTQQDDYDKVEGVEPVPVGVNPNTGEPILAHLLAKPKAFFEEDQQKADEKRRAVEKALLTDPRAAAQAGAGANPNNPDVQMAGGTYVAAGSKIGRSNQILE